MKSLLESFKKVKPDELTYSALFDRIIPFISKEIDYKAYVPEIIDDQEYARNILLEDPLEVVLIKWPAGVESAIHFHEGFWGYVGVLEGVASNTEYYFDKDVLKQKRAVVIKKGGLIPEPDGVIHKLANHSKTEFLVTLHFYYPPLKDLNGLKLFGEDGTISVLNEKATSASLNLPSDCYLSFERGQFKFDDDSHGKTHLITPILPKPDAAEIKKMVSEYYSDQAKHYDTSDVDNELRYKYVQAINLLLIDEFKINQPERVLALACGTGRRAAKIKDLSNLEYKLFGVDISKEMTELARQKGIEAHCSDWLEIDFPDNYFDAITMLYSFGHIPESKERLQFVEKVFDKLTHGGAFYVDVFNIDDKYEWGQNALDVFEEYNLDYFGYEKGDVFYRRKFSDKIAFLHYFDAKRSVDLLKSIGFKVEHVDYIGYMNRCGELLDDINGKIFIKAIKP
jgi:ubiquinone/menaquinone biosynthesis C-methylase UbiE/predicted metal-dependent enzyme (double-stranded beta helix superfamily)